MSGPVNQADVDERIAVSKVGGKEALDDVFFDLPERELRTQENIASHRSNRKIRSRLTNNITDFHKFVDEVTTEIKAELEEISSSAKDTRDAKKANQISDKEHTKQNEELAKRTKNLQKHITRLHSSIKIELKQYLSEETLAAERDGRLELPQARLLAEIDASFAEISTATEAFQAENNRSTSASLGQVSGQLTKIQLDVKALHPTSLGAGQFLDPDAPAELEHEIIAVDPRSGKQTKYEITNEALINIATGNSEAGAHLRESALEELQARRLRDPEVRKEYGTQDRDNLPEHEFRLPQSGPLAKIFRNPNNEAILIKMFGHYQNEVVAAGGPDESAALLQDTWEPQNIHIQRVIANHYPQEALTDREYRNLKSSLHKDPTRADQKENKIYAGFNMEVEYTPSMTDRFKDFLKSDVFSLKTYADLFSSKKTAQVRLLNYDLKTEHYETILEALQEIYDIAEDGTMTLKKEIGQKQVDKASSILFEKLAYEGGKDASGMGTFGYFENCKLKAEYMSCKGKIRYGDFNGIGMKNVDLEDLEFAECRALGSKWENVNSRGGNLGLICYGSKIDIQLHGTMLKGFHPGAQTTFSDRFFKFLGDYRKQNFNYNYFKDSFLKWEHFTPSGFKNLSFGKLLEPIAFWKPQRMLEAWGSIFIGSPLRIISKIPGLGDYLYSRQVVMDDVDFTKGKIGDEPSSFASELNTYLQNRTLAAYKFRKLDLQQNAYDELLAAGANEKRLEEAYTTASQILPSFGETTSYADVHGVVDTRMAGTKNTEHIFSLLGVAVYKTIHDNSGIVDQDETDVVIVGKGFKIEARRVPNEMFDAVMAHYHHLTQSLGKKRDFSIRDYAEIKEKAGQSFNLNSTDNLFLDQLRNPYKYITMRRHGLHIDDASIVVEHMANITGVGGS